MRALANPNDFLSLLLGTQSAGASAGLISTLPVSTLGEGSTLLASSCQICCEDYVVGVVLKTLPCLHMYHEECIDKWLTQKGTCPVCLQPIAVDESTLDFS